MSERTYGVDFYDGEGWVDNNSEWDTYAYAACEAERRLRADPKITHAIVSRTVKTEMKKFSLELREKVVK